LSSVVSKSEHRGAAAELLEHPLSSPPASLSEKAYREIEELIVTLRLEPGAILSEVALCEQLDIGRTPVREALHRLAREGLVVILPRRGILVSQINVESQLRLLEGRREIERLIARRAAKLSTETEREIFREIALGMQQADKEADDIAFLRLDRLFNIVSCKAARNEYAANAMGLMHGLSRRFWYQHYKDVADLPRCARLHADLSTAIADGNVDAAAAASDRLLDYIENFTCETLEVNRNRR